MTGGRPPCLPLRAAVSRPSSVGSRMFSRRIQPPGRVVDASPGGCGLRFFFRALARDGRGEAEIETAVHVELEPAVRMAARENTLL